MKKEVGQDYVLSPKYCVLNALTRARRKKEALREKEIIINTFSNRKRKLNIKLRQRMVLRYADEISSGIVRKNEKVMKKISSRTEEESYKKNCSI